MYAATDILGAFDLLLLTYWIKVIVDVVNWLVPQYIVSCDVVTRELCSSQLTGYQRKEKR